MAVEESTALLERRRPVGARPAREEEWSAGARSVRDPAREEEWTAGARSARDPAGQRGWRENPKVKTK
jgi:hypothetical protein